MGLPYTHTVTITRVVEAAPGAPRDDFGEPITPPTPLTIYTGPADVQDMTHRDQRSVFGDTTIDGAARVFLPGPGLGGAQWPAGVRPEDLVTAVETNPGIGGTITLKGRVHDMDLLDPSAIVRWEPRPTTQT